MQGRTRTVLPFSTPTSMNNTDATDADAIWPNVPQQRQRHSRDHPNCSAWQGVTPGIRTTRTLPISVNLGHATTGRPMYGSPTIHPVATVNDTPLGRIW